MKRGHMVNGLWGVYVSDQISPYTAAMERSTYQELQKHANNGDRSMWKTVLTKTEE